MEAKSAHEDRTVCCGLFKPRRKNGVPAPERAAPMKKPGGVFRFSSRGRDSTPPHISRRRTTRERDAKFFEGQAQGNLCLARRNVPSGGRHEVPRAGLVEVCSKSYRPIVVGF